MSVPVLSLHCTSSSEVIRELDREYSSFVAPVFCNMYPSSLIERCAYRYLGHKSKHILDDGMISRTTLGGRR